MGGRERNPHPHTQQQRGQTQATEEKRLSPTLAGRASPGGTARHGDTRGPASASHDADDGVEDTNTPAKERSTLQRRHPDVHECCVAGRQEMLLLNHSA